MDALTILQKNVQNLKLFARLFNNYLEDKWQFEYINKKMSAQRNQV